MQIGGVWQYVQYLRVWRRKKLCIAVHIGDLLHDLQQEASVT